MACESGRPNLAQRLVPEAGLVRRLPNPDDRRALIVELTPQGDEVWQAATAAQAAKEVAFASALSRRERDELNRLCAG